MIFSRETSSNITLDYWLVVSNHGFLWLSGVLGISSSQVTKSYFSEVFKPPTSNISSLMMSYDLDTMIYRWTNRYRIRYFLPDDVYIYIDIIRWVEKSADVRIFVFFYLAVFWTSDRRGLLKSSVYRYIYIYTYKLYIYNYIYIQLYIYNYIYICINR